MGGKASHPSMNRPGKRSAPRRPKALRIHTEDLESAPLDRYAALQKSIGRLMTIGKVDVDVDQVILRRFLCDRHRCIQWTPHEKKKDAKPIIDRSCCSSYNVSISPSDREKVEEILPLVRKRLAKNHPLVTDPTEPFYDIDDDFSFQLRETDRGTCEFVLYEEGLTTCAVHKTCLEEGLDVAEYKPIVCSLWPLALIDYEADGETRYFLTAYGATNAGIFEGSDNDEDEDPGADRFACLVDDSPGYEPLYRSHGEILRFLLGDKFYEELDRRARARKHS
jgi:hypothetical protein